MASFFDRFLGRRELTSARAAKERLKLVLVTDRSDLAPEKLEQMQAEIIQVIKRYLQINEARVEIKLEQRDRKNYLVADIPLMRDQSYQPIEPDLRGREVVTQEPEEDAAKADAPALDEPDISADDTRRRRIDPPQEPDNA
ncbi:MAG: cell division topological specificity factor MinE [Chloroflexi bacterium]|jgi:cell division topological specificity factor|nr:cell division topological specificity factor MinE [Chloroflexota bacterium]